MQETFDWDSIDVHPMALIPVLYNFENLVADISAAESDEEALKLARSQGYDYSGDIKMTCRAIILDIEGLTNAIKNKCVERLN